MKGLFSALLVSFDKDGSINEKGLREIVRYNIDVCKVDGLYNTLKLILQEKGVDAGYCRAPFKHHTEKQIERSKEIASKYF